MAQDRWERRYYEAIERLERDEARWGRVETLLRRMSGRLAVAARGHGASLDAVLDQVVRHCREPADERALQPLLGELSTAIAALDAAPSATADGDATDDAPATALLLAVVDRLRLLPELQPRAQALRGDILAACEPAALTALAGAVAAIVNQQRELLQEDRLKLETVLRQVTARLDGVAQFLVNESSEHDTRRAARLAFDDRMQGEMRALDSQVATVADLDSLQHLVRSRLNAVVGHLQDFRAREDEREKHWLQRADHMRARIDELERESRELQQSLRQEQQLATTDALTGLANRLAWDDRIAEACRRRKRFDQPVSLLIFDIDHFKTINDRYGHAAGDRVLRIVGGELRKQLREIDFVARYGGEEFVVLLEGSDAPAALQVGEKLRRLIESLGFHVQQQPVRITVSCGVTALTSGDTPESVFERADAALYGAKQNGRNGCVMG